jgi:EAL domain-containing protein (putative c-di-GMP-specific phosphodiesterase class I)
MRRLTDVVIDDALRQVAEWLRLGLRVPVAVNVSMRDLRDDDFAVRVADGLRRHQVPARLLSLEITERVLIDDPARTSATLARLEELGVSSSLDDFGTGYSSLTMLKRLPVREIKVDKSFVELLGHAAGGADDAAIVRSIIDLGHSLGLTVVAEGVESSEALELLRVYGCDRAQGWHVSHALPAAETTLWLRDRQSPRHLRLADGASAGTPSAGDAVAG